MHTFDGFQRNGLTVGKLLRPDLASLSSTLVAVALIKFNSPLGVVPDTFTVVGIGFKSLTLVVGPKIATNGKPLLGIGELCCGLGIGHTTTEKLVAGFIALGNW